MSVPNKDWKIEQLRDLETAFRVAVSGSDNPLGKRVYLNGEPCIVRHLLLVQPSVAANHAGESLEIDLIDSENDKHEIRLYTSDWPEGRR